MTYRVRSELLVGSVYWLAFQINGLRIERVANVPDFA